MEKLKELLKKIQELDVDVMMFEIMSNKALQRAVIEFNHKQLLNGKDIKGVPLSSYRAYSEAYAAFKGSNIVDLNLTGDFYNTFKVENRLGGFSIVADTMLYDYDFNDVYGGNLLGLDRGNLTELQSILLPYIDNYLKKYLDV